MIPCAANPGNEVSAPASRTDVRRASPSVGAVGRFQPAHQSQPVRRRRSAFRTGGVQLPTHIVEQLLGEQLRPFTGLHRPQLQHEVLLAARVWIAGWYLPKGEVPQLYCVLHQHFNLFRYSVEGALFGSG